MPPAAQSSKNCPNCHCPRPAEASTRAVNIVSQIITIAAAIAFGVFAVLSWQVGVQSRGESKVANQMSIINMCMSNDVSITMTTLFPSGRLGLIHLPYCRDLPTRLPVNKL